MRMFVSVALVGLAAAASACNGNNGPTPPSPSANGVTVAASTTNQAVMRPVRVAGQVSNLAGACPALSFTVGSTAVSTSASTVFPDGDCAGVANGTMVEIDGTPQPNGSVAATRVVLPQLQPQPARVSGVVSGLAGTCPVLTFTLGTTAVSTTSTTTFDGVGCAALANGSNVGVAGTTQTDGSILASRVFVAPAGATPSAVARGLVSALAGTCPALTFTLGTTAVSTTSTTTFVGGACSALADGSQVGARGTRQPDGSIVADRVFVAPGHSDNK
jgi:hypothetical protein